MQQDRQYCILSEDRHRCCDLDLWPYNPKINGFPGIIVEHLYVKFGDPSCTGFGNIDWKRGKNPTHMTAVGVGNKYTVKLNTYIQFYIY